MLATATKANVGTITSSPGPIPSAAKVRWSPAVPDVTATACFVPQASARIASNRLTYGPFDDTHPERTASETRSNSRTPMTGSAIGINGRCGMIFSPCAVVIPARDAQPGLDAAQQWDGPLGARHDNADDPGLAHCRTRISHRPHVHTAECSLHDACIAAQIRQYRSSLVGGACSAGRQNGTLSRRAAASPGPDVALRCSEPASPTRRRRRSPCLTSVQPASRYRHDAVTGVTIRDGSRSAARSRHRALRARQPRHPPPH